MPSTNNFEILLLIVEKHDFSTFSLLFEVPLHLGLNPPSSPPPSRVNTTLALTTVRFPASNSRISMTYWPGTTYCGTMPNCTRAPVRLTVPSYGHGCTSWGKLALIFSISIAAIRAVAGSRADEAGEDSSSRGHSSTVVPYSRVRDF